MAVQDLQKNQMMSHLLAALEAGTDIGKYGRLVFTQVARQFLGMDEVIAWLQKNPGISEEDARALYFRVGGDEFIPPTVEEIRAWQQQQEFPICPDLNNPQVCDVYQNLQFPEGIYQHRRSPNERKGIGN